MVSSCRRRTTSECDGSVTPCGSIPSPSPSRYSSIALSRDSPDYKYALGTLEYRKQRNRKRTKTGEYVWSDEADLVFTMALMSWTSDRSNRIGTRRSNFLQQYLARYGFTKTRKQIASRLQVLRGEWRATSYLSLLDDPDSPSSLSRPRIPPSSPSDGGEQRRPSSPFSFTSSSPTSPKSTFPSNEPYPLTGTTYETKPMESRAFLFPPTVQSHKLPTRSFVQDSHSLSVDRPYQLLERSDIPLEAAGHRLHIYAPTPVSILKPPTSFQMPYQVVTPIPSISQALHSNSSTPCVPNYEGSSRNVSLGGSFRHTHPFTY